MKSKKIGLVLVIASAFITTSIFATGLPTDHVKQSADGKQTVYSGSGLPSLLNELAARGIDPNRLRTVDNDGNVITPFTPGTTVSWEHVVNNAPTGGFNGGGRLHANNLADGTGKPGDIQTDTVVHGTTVTVFVWQYQAQPGGGYAWVAIGVSSYTISSGTQQK
jgi:hypothetical protein